MGSLVGAIQIGGRQQVVGTKGVIQAMKGVSKEAELLFRVHRPHGSIRHEDGACIDRDAGKGVEGVHDAVQDLGQEIPCVAWGRDGCIVEKAWFHQGQQGALFRCVRARRDDCP